MMLQLSRQTVRRGWPPYLGAFAGLACGVVLIALTVTIVASVAATENRPGVTAADLAQLDGLSSLFGVMAGVSVFMAILVVGSTFGFVVAIRRRELGLLRLLGATPRQVRRLILGESAVVAALAVVAGCLVTTAAAPAALGLVRTAGITDLHLSAPSPWLALVIAAPSGTGVALLGSWRSSRRAAKVPPVAAIQDAVVERRRPSVVQLAVGTLCLLAVGTAVAVVERFDPIFALLVGIFLPEVVVIGLLCFGTVVFPWLAGLLARPFVRRDVAARLARDHVRTAARTPAAVAAPVVAISAIAGSLILTLSLTADWTIAQDRAQLRAPLVVELGDSRAAGLVSRDPAVAVADLRLPLSLRLDGDTAEQTINAEAVDVVAAGRARGLHAVRGDLAALHGNTLAVSRGWTTDSGKNLGDSVSAEVNGRTVALRIVAVVPDAPDLYGELLVPSDLATGQPDLAFVQPRPGVTSAAAATALESRLRGTHSEVVTAETWLDRIDHDTRKNNNLGLWVLLGPSGLYAGIAMVNSVLIGASQRRRQRRILDQLGATREQLRRTALWEGGLVGGAALLVGAAVTGFVGWIVHRATAADVGSAGDLELTVPWLPLGAVAVTCAVLVLGAALTGARERSAGPVSRGSRPR